MDLLGGYDDSDAEEEVKDKPAQSPSEQLPKTAPSLHTRNAAPEEGSQAEPAKLFNPFADDEAGRGTSHTGASPSGTKRDFTKVTGPGPIQDAPPKAPRSAATTSTSPKPPFNTALVPPQLRHGRANVSTEDVDKLFTKGRLQQGKKQPEAEK